MSTLKKEDPAFKTMEEYITEPMLFDNDDGNVTEYKSREKTGPMVREHERF